MEPRQGRTGRSDADALRGRGARRGEDESWRAPAARAEQDTGSQPAREIDRAAAEWTTSSRLFDGRARELSAESSCWVG